MVQSTVTEPGASLGLALRQLQATLARRQQARFGAELPGDTEPPTACRPLARRRPVAGLSPAELRRVADRVDRLLGSERAAQRSVSHLGPSSGPIPSPVAAGERKGEGAHPGRQLPWGL